MDVQRRVLIVGAGSIGERHVRCFQATGRADVAICETVPERRQTVADRYGMVSAFGELDQAIRHADAEVAVIATPAPSHIPIAHRLAEAGMHLLIEKPLSVSLTDIDRLDTIVQQNRLTCGVAYNWRFHPLIEQVYNFLSTSPFGRPLQLVCYSGQCFPYHRPAYREIYYTDRATGGGAIQDAMTHMLNLGEWFVGPIRRVAADALHQRLEGVTVEDTVHVMTRHGPDAGVMGSYNLNQFQPANESSWWIVLEGGVVRWDVSGGRWMWQDDPASDWQITSCPVPERDAMYVAQADEFLDAVEGKCLPRCTLAEGLQTLRANLAVLDAVDNDRSLVPIE